jgi:uncharacterized membrane protein YfcA
MFGLDLTIEAWIAASAVLMIGTVIQGCVGFGGNLLAVPIVLLFAEQLVPGPMLIPAFVLSLLMMVREWGEADLRGVGWALSGRIPGGVAGAAVLTAISGDLLSLVFGGLILVAVAISAAGMTVRQNPPTLFAAGTASGFMATAVAVGGPPIALVYQSDEGPRIRTTLALFLNLGTVASVIALAAFGEFGLDELKLGLLMVPATLLGLWASGPLRERVDAGYLRNAVLALSALAALIAIARGLF